MNSADSKSGTYEAPEVTVYGNITQITRAGEGGLTFDGTFTPGDAIPDPDDDGQPNIFS